MTALGTALDYAARGWRVVPIKPGEKSPAVKKWETVATCDPKTLELWWGTRWPDHGIGIATGTETGFFVLDVDSANGKRGDDSLAELEATYGPLPATVEVVTGSGGRHLYFRMPVAPLRNSAGLLGVDLDVRADGGQVLAPPTIHPTTGQAYEWEASSHPDDVPIADPPDWLVELLTQAPATQPRDDRPAYEGEQRPGDRFAAQHSWRELLEADGCTYFGTRYDPPTDSHFELWGRPPMPGEEGFEPHVSGSLYFGGTDVLKVFSSNWGNLEAERTYTRFGYWTAMHHDGDFDAATRALGDAERAAEAVDDWTVNLTLAAPSSLSSTASETTEQPHNYLVQWAEFWDAEDAEHDWVVYPLVPAGRAVALYAAAKAGKSTIVLDGVIAAATGRAPFGATDPKPPQSILYLDYEMTDADLRERLYETGYGPEVNLTHLHYALLPPMPPLDTKDGAAALLKLAQSVNARLVVVDTFGRAVEGEENDADTVRKFYRHTAIALKAAGIAVLRTDHSGKDVGKGQRGSSAKNDDVDIVWQLKRTDDGVKLTRTHTRISWVPEHVDITKTKDADGIVSYTTEKRSKGYPAGTKQKAEALDDLGAALDITNAAARELLKGAGMAAANDVLSAALRFRRSEAERRFVEVSTNGTGHGTPNRGSDGTDPRNAASENGTETNVQVTASERVTERPRNAEQHPDGTPRIQRSDAGGTVRPVGVSPTGRTLFGTPTDPCPEETPK